MTFEKISFSSFLFERKSDKRETTSLNDALIAISLRDSTCAIVLPRQQAKRFFKKEKNTREIYSSAYLRQCQTKVCNPIYFLLIFCF
jgi:hypothetical protein